MEGESNAAEQLENFPQENPPNFRILKAKSEGMEIDPKYVFDPKNPKDFKAYGLLQKIVREEKNYGLIDLFWFSNILEKRIFDKETESKIWDKPENYSSLNGYEKAKVFFENYSPLEYWEEIIKKEINISETVLEGLFIHFTNGNDYLTGLDRRRKEVKNKINRDTIGTKWLLDFFMSKNVEPITIARSCLFFATSFSLGFKNNWVFQKTSAVIMFKEDFHKAFKSYDPSRKKLISTHFEMYGVVPVVLDRYEDFEHLISLLQRDKDGSIDVQETPKLIDSVVSLARIKNYFSIYGLELVNASPPGETILLGNNGEGKTLILQAIALALKGNPNHWQGIEKVGHITDILRQNKSGEMVLEVETDQGSYQFDRNPAENTMPEVTVMGYGIGRFRNDSQKMEESGIGTLFSTDQYLESPVEWLKYLDHKAARNESTPVSVAEAVNMLQELLGGEVKIQVLGTEIKFYEKDSPLNFDQLSDGYKSVLIWVCDMVARLAKAQPGANGLSEFHGIVLVDEIGVFLHPTWQYQIIGRLRAWFPKIQWIFTTHSPVVVLGASPDAVFYRVYKENGETKISQPVKNVRSLTANTVLTSPLFGLESPGVRGVESEDIETSDEFVYTHIHRKIAERLKGMAHYGEEDLMKMIDEELDKYVEEQSK